MATRYSPTDYLYSTARIRALENGLIGEETLVTLFERGSAEEAAAALSAFGLPLQKTADGRMDTEAMLSEYLKKGTAAVLESIPDKSLLASLQYPYDCHNLKAILKAGVRGVAAAPLMIDGGSVPVPTLLAALSEGDTSCLPTHMRAAFAEAKERFAKTGDPQDLDVTLDVAVFRDMSDAVADFPFGGAILSKRADVTNIKTVWRLLQYGNKYLAPALFKRAAVTGGTLSPSFFSPALEGTVTLPELLKSTPYGYFFGKTDVSAAHLEKLSDDAVMHEAKAAKQVAFGPEVPYAFVLALQTAVQNLRLLFAAKAAGLSSAEFRKRVRACYV